MATNAPDDTIPNPKRAPDTIPIDRNRDSDVEKGERDPSPRELDPEALEADRSMARTSDHTDARDGVDASDTFDPDGLGGKPQPKAPRLDDAATHAGGKARNPRRR